ncbi:MAG: hypothetical protein WKF93_03035 [Acidimicrobiales bacterium]
MTERPLLLCGDLGSERCGVGASESAALAAVGSRPHTVDPRHVGASLRGLLRARRSRQVVVVAYPTRSTVRSVRATVTLALAAGLGRGRIRWHLHEYAIFGERRALIDLLLVVGGGRVVVSTRSEAAALRRSRGGRVAHRVDVRVIPPANGTPVATAPVATGAPADPPIVGLFGTARADKGLDVAVAALDSALQTEARVETIGSGWDEAPWPPGVLDHLDVRHHGRLPTARLASVMTRWTLAVAPFADGATDGRMSLRTPLACGIPTLTTVARAEDLTLRPPHLLLDPATAWADARATDPAARADGAAAVARFEAETGRALAAALWDAP